jgi:hypothetical protein
MFHDFLPRERAHWEEVTRVERWRVEQWKHVTRLEGVVSSSEAAQSGSNKIGHL